MNWIKLEDEQQLEKIKEISSENPVLIFKHSTRCATSSMALHRLEKEWHSEDMKNLTPYFLDLISYREISNKTAEIFNIRHESPQVLIIKNGECIYHASHLEISYKELNKKFLPVKN